MKITRILALISIVVMFAAIAAACATDDDGTAPITAIDDNAAGTDNADLDEPEAPGFRVSRERENIPDSDFGGYNFVMLVEDPYEKVWTYTNMIVEELTGDIIDDAFYRRNLLVEERLNIHLSQRPASLGSIQREFTREVESGAGGFDVAFIRYYVAARLAMQNYCVALNDIPYIDMDKPWWDQGARRDLSIAHRNYFMASDMTIADNDNTWIMFFDTQLVQDLQLEMPYDLVNEGRWTFSKMHEMMRVAEFDVDGDGVMTRNDRFGLLTHGENYAGMWIAAGQRLFTKNEQDMPELAFGDESFINVWHQIIEIMNCTSAYTRYIPFISSGLANGQTLFATEILKFVRDYRGNERDFGIVPMPKFNEQQDSYHTYVALSAPLLLVPVSNPDLERTGIIIEAMAAEGHRTILSAYYEVSIEGQFVRDEESIEMLNIAFATRLYDLGVVFDWGGVVGQLRTLGDRNDGGIASLLDRHGERIQAAMDNTFAAFEGN